MVLSAAHVTTVSFVRRYSVLTILRYCSSCPGLGNVQSNGGLDLLGKIDAVVLLYIYLRKLILEFIGLKILKVNWLVNTVSRETSDKC